MTLSHRFLLEDAVRTQAFRDAIHEVVRPGELVADLGTGTGVLACFACQAGARRVYAVERSEIIQTARQLAAANGYTDRIVFLRGDAADVVLPEQVDVVIGELLGPMGFDENLLPLFERAVRAHLAPGGRLVPASLAVFAAPWETPSFYGSIDFWGREHYGLRFDPVRALAMNQVYGAPLDPAGALAPADALWRLALPGLLPDPASAALSFEVQRHGTLHGFAGWFEAGLSSRVTLTTSPSAPPTHWGQAFFPVEKPVAVEPGDRVTLKMTASGVGGRTLWGWSGIIRRGDRTLGTFDAHTFRSLPFSRETFRRHRPPA